MQAHPCNIKINLVTLKQKSWSHAIPERHYGFPKTFRYRVRKLPVTSQRRPVRSCLWLPWTPLCGSGLRAWIPIYLLKPWRLLGASLWASVFVVLGPGNHMSVNGGTVGPTSWGSIFSWWQVSSGVRQWRWRNPDSQRPIGNEELTADVVASVLPQKLMWCLWPRYCVSKFIIDNEGSPRPSHADNSCVQVWEDDLAPQGADMRTVQSNIPGNLALWWPFYMNLCVYVCTCLLVRVYV